MYNDAETTELWIGTFLGASNWFYGYLIHWELTNYQPNSHTPIQLSSSTCLFGYYRDQET
ncbi:MAG: hypothetical protein V2I33_25940 [Kangiellaceae bacterium]|jgi:hypothetical protein|nr:hypothetical protein [Kangiellaceae bacterium]